MPEDAGAAAKAFASLLVEAVAKTELVGDPEVQVAFGLGWHMAELYMPGTWPGHPPQASEQNLPGLSDFSARQRAQLGLDQVDVGLSRIKAQLTEHGLQVPTTEEASAFGRRATAVPRSDLRTARGAPGDAGAYTPPAPIGDRLSPTIGI
jgi:hypothetical protein